MPEVPIRVLIADRYPIVLAGLQRVLGQCSDIQIVGETTDGPQIINQTIHLDPDVVLMDLNLLKIAGLAVIRDIQKRAPRSKVILFASAECKDDFVAVMKLGCSGILLKNCPTGLIPKSVRKIHAGELWVDTHTTAALVHQLGSLNALAAKPFIGTPICNQLELSQRERGVLFLIARGLTNRQIAERMSISENTVRNHLHNIFQKLGVFDRLELALYAVHKGMY